MIVELPDEDGADEGEESGGPGDAVRASFELWLELRDRGLPVDTGRLAADLPPAQRADLERRIGHHEAIDRRLRAAIGGRSAPEEGGDAEPTGVPGRYVDLRDPKPGGMGVVYRVRDVELGRDVAYKVMKAHSVDADDFRGRFAREAEITATLQYPGIVPIFGMVTDGCGRPAYAMGYIEGVNFRELAERPVVLRERLSSFLAACRIVEHAHKKKFVHGDLSLKNLMLADDGATHVVDWGLARCLDPDSPLFRSNGAPSPDSKEPFTLAFASPSVRKGGPKTYSTDVYSLGAILAALVLGIKPDGAPDLDGLERKDAPRALRAIIKQAMADRDDGLYPDAGALAEDIGRFLNGEKVRADLGEPRRERAWRMIRRHPARATLAVASVLLVSIVSTSAALVVAARESVARKEQEALRLSEEVASARQEVLWGQASTAMLRCESILRQNPTPELVSTSMIDPLVKILSLLGQKPDLPDEVIDLNRVNEEWFRQFDMERQLAERKAAEPELREIINILERLDGKFPEPRQVRLQLAKSYLALGALEIVRVTNELNLVKFYLITKATLSSKPPSQPEVEAALAKIEKALELLAGDPPQPSEQDWHRQLLVRARNARGLALARLGRFTECCMSYDQALPLARGLEASAIQRFRAVYLKAAEVEQSHMPWSDPPRVDHVKAIRTADYLVAQPKVSPEAVFNAACAFSLASVDERADSAERERRATRAVALLARIEAKNYFRKPKKAGELREDDALNPLRSRGDFRALAARVAKGG